MDKREIISGGLWLCIAVAVLAASVRLGLGAYDNPGPGFLAFGSGVLLAVLSGALLVVSVSAKEKPVPLTDLWRGRQWSIPLLAAATLILYGLVLSKLGYLIATGALMVVLFYLGKSKLRLAIPGALLAALATFFLFQYLLKMPLPRGLFGF
jgi:putative tricarboxylic transport membrane protein